MHWRRYKRLRRRHAQAFERSLMGLAKSAERLERWLSETMSKEKSKTAEQGSDAGA
jgi:hypothetical protein